MADGDKDGGSASKVSDAALDATQGLALPVTPAGASSSPRPPGVSQGFARGDLVAERYKILRMLGEGGMGEVYEAEDLLLRERVALKTVRNDVAALDPKVLERFKREIQLARKVTHPNVCRIFDVGLHRPRDGRNDVAFLTMELLEGETLAARLMRVGRIAHTEAAPLVAQMAAALDAAHQEGIVHRDFKSANVMLVEGSRGTRAVVTDFGLARGRQAATDPTITGDGGVVGSPSYMAPEQVEGKEITPAADIYALGVVMYEMVTGRLPFVGDTPLSTAVKRLREDPETPCAHVTGLDPRWERVILHCLKRERTQRPASAREVSEAVAPTAPRTRPWVRALAIGVPVVTALALLGLTVVRRGGASTTGDTLPLEAAAVVAPGDSHRRAVAVLGFKNLTGRPETDWISGALAEMLTTELSASADIRVVSGESVARAKRGLALGDEINFAPDTLVRLRQALGADYVLTGSYMAPGKDSGGRVRLDLKLVDTRTGEIAAVLTQTGAEADLVDLVARTGETLRGRLSLGALSPSEKEAARASQPRGDVARLYSEGLAQLRVAACSAARAPLEQAVATDPSFPQARSALAEALSCLGIHDRALAEAKKAVELATDNNLPDHIRLTAEAQLFRLSKQPDKAIEAYEKLFKRFPDNFDYGYRLAELQVGRREADFPQTLAALRRLPPPAGDNPQIDLLEAYAELNAGRFIDGLAKVQAARARAEQQGLRLVSADGGLVEARIQLALKKTDEALAVAEKSRVLYEAANDLDGVAKTLALEAAVREAQGDQAGVERAQKQVESIARNLENPRQMWSFKFMLGIRMMSQGRVDNAITAFEDAREIARGVKDPVLVAQATQLAAFTQILRGEMKSAEAMLVALPTDGMQPDQRAGVLGGLASLAAARDETAEAQKIIDEAAAVATPAGKPQIELLRINILNDEEKYVEAAKRARALIASSQGFAAPARFQLAEALLGNKAWDEARLVIDEIEKTQYKGEFTGEMQMATFKARLDAVKGDVAEARRELAEIAAKADDNGARLLALGARHELAKVELEHGDRQKAHALFAGLARDAAAMGCTRLARQARERMN